MPDGYKKAFWKRLRALTEEYLPIAQSNKEVWNQFLEYGPADLQVIRAHLRKELDSLDPDGNPTTKSIEREIGIEIEVIKVTADLGAREEQEVPVEIPKRLLDGEGSDFDIDDMWDVVKEKLKYKKNKEVISRAQYVAEKMFGMHALGRRVPPFGELTLERLESLGEQSYVGFSEEIKQARRLSLEKIEKSGTNMQRQRLNRLEATLSEGSFSDLNYVYYEMIEEEGKPVQLESMQRHFKRMFDSASNDTARDRRPGSLEDLEQIAELWRDVRSGQ